MKQRAFILFAACAVAVSACGAIRIGVARPAVPTDAPAKPALTGPVSTQQKAQTAALLRAVVEGHANLQRPDGWAYTVDVAQLMTYSVLTRDSARYRELRTYALNNLIRSDRSDPYTNGFVIWRSSARFPADASGTTEALRLAEAMWLGITAFGDAAAKPFVIDILHGYARHEYLDQDVWLIRNYFNLATRAFANNSFIVDYDPDFLSTVARATGDTMIARVAGRSYELVRKAVTPSGLLNEMVQPEVLTALPKLGQPFFSPNDWVNIANSCTVAERSLEQAPERARAIVAFMAKQSAAPGSYYFGRTGEPVDRGEASLASAACIARLAHRTGDIAVRDTYLQWMVREMNEIQRTAYPLDLFSAVEALTTLYVVEQPPGTPVPLPAGR